MTPTQRLLLVTSVLLAACADDVSEADDTSSSSGPGTTSATLTTSTTASTTQTTTTDSDTSGTSGVDSTGSETASDSTTSGESSTEDTASESSSDGSGTSSGSDSSSTGGSDSTGTTGETDSTGTTTGFVCVDAIECDDQLPCTADDCVDGDCESTPVDDGPAPSQTAGDCQIVLCAGGSDAAQADDTDLPDDGNECTDDLCMAGVPSHPPISLGTACGTDGLCDGMGNCVECASPDDCDQLPPDDDCQTRTCNAGVCGQSFAAQGTPVSQQAAGDCEAIVCDGMGGTTPVEDGGDVPVDGLECTDDECVAGVPENPPVAAGAACMAGVCDGMGGCVGCLVPGDCGGMDTFCQTITCMNDTCGVDNTAAGTPLPANQQTMECVELQCDGNGMVQGVDETNGTSCDDGAFCNGPDTCDGMGTCASGPAPCTPLQQVCIEATDECQANSWINEFHYDNSGTDAGEFIEVALAAGVDPAMVTVTLYNGATGQAYGTHPLGTFVAGAAVNGITLYSKLLPANGIQNGSPDGLALDVAGEVIEFLSYEGGFMAVDGPATGLGSTDVGVLEDGTMDGTSIGRIGMGNQASEFTWALIADDTPGDVNSGQAIN